MKRTLAVLWCVAGAVLFAAAAGSAQDGLLTVGYAVVTHDEPGATTQDLAVFETFGHQQAGAGVQAGVLPGEMTREAVLFVNSSRSLSRQLGVAIINPNANPVQVTLRLRATDGAQMDTATVTIPARGQTSQFVNQLFEERTVVHEFSGSLHISAPDPIAVVGLRFRGTNFSTLPIVNVTPAGSVPQITPNAGGAGAFLLPQFAAGGGWASEIIVLNYGTSGHRVRIDLFNQDGTPLVTTMNGRTDSAFTFDLNGGGTLILSPRDPAGNSPF